MKKEIVTTRDASLVFNKSKSTLNVTKKILSKDTSLILENNEEVSSKPLTKVRKISDDQTKVIEFGDQVEAWIDKDTGLMWEVKTKENIEHKYIWSEEWIEKALCPECLTDSVKDAFSYAKKLNELNYAGFSDWRIPTMEELETLLTKKKVNDWYIKFPLSKNSSSGYWSSIATEFYEDDSADGAYFRTGGKFNDNKCTNQYVRCVRIVKNFITEETEEWIRILLDWADNESLYEMSCNNDDNFTYGLPREKKNLLNVEKIIIEGCQIAEIPKEIGGLFNLTYFNLSKNNLKELPKEIGNLTNLTHLLAGENNLKELPKEIGNLINLTYLNINFNEYLEEIPKEIGNLIDLTFLGLYVNGLKKIPKGIGKLINLNELDLSNNKLKKIPTEIGKLINLKRLDLANNKLKELPVEITHLKNLDDLSLGGNDLSKLPKDIITLKKLKHLNLTKMPLVLNSEQIKWIQDLKNNGCWIDTDENYFE